MWRQEKQELPRLPLLSSSQTGNTHSGPALYLSPVAYHGGLTFPHCVFPFHKSYVSSDISTQYKTPHLFLVGKAKLNRGECGVKTLDETFFAQSQEDRALWVADQGGGCEAGLHLVVYSVLHLFRREVTHSLVLRLST